MRRGRSPARVDASGDGKRIERVAGGRRVLPSTRHQRHRRRLPDDVRRRRGLRTQMHAVDSRSDRRAARMTLARRCAWILILIVDVGLVAWGVMAAAFLDHLLGPGGTPILPAGYEGFSKSS